MMLLSCYIVTFILACCRKGNDWKETFFLMLAQGLVLGGLEVAVKLCYI